jgi:hypothetical protein
MSCGELWQGVPEARTQWPQEPNASMNSPHQSGRRARSDAEYILITQAGTERSRAAHFLPCFGFDLP